MGRKIGRVDRLAVHRRGEAKQRLRQVARELKPDRAWTVMPFLQTNEFDLRAQILQVQIVGPLLLFSGPLRLRIGALPLPVAFLQQGTHRRLQGFAAFG